ncbi:MAG: rod shape-determining protein RodA [Deltaproteobacteria bacterium]|nr:rod shape-determining protein RodA [Deltaproteobacteria bacterium]
MKATRPALIEVNWPLVGAMLLIASLGIYNLHSSAASHAPRLFLGQLAVLGVGSVVCALLLFFDYRLSEGIAYPVYGLACLLLLAVLLQGRSALGAQRWLLIGPASFQPSEPAKLATILCLARYCSQRIDPSGYSMRTLFRPLNPSRPLAALLALVLLWKKPWLGDPIGELARLFHKNLGGVVPEAGDLLWFRLFLVALILAAVTAGVWIVVGIDRARALLDPWPPGRRNRLVLLCVAFGAGLGLALFSVWSAPFVRDPFGVAIATLVEEADAGGAYAGFAPTTTLRAVLAIAVVVYAVLSLWSLRSPVASLVDFVIAPVDLLAIPALLVLVEPDLGTAGIFVVVGMSMILVVGVQLRTLLILGCVGASLAVVGWFGILKDYQKRRILTFIDPEHDIKGAGWNAVQSMIAVGSGRWTGKGHLEGTQSQLSFLPEQHTDFAFSVWAEEQGFLGCLVVMALYVVLVAAIWSIAAQARDSYGALLAAGVASMILWQALINIGMVIGVLPVVGVTLPLFSYGGSSLLTVMLGCALALNVHLHRRAH